VYKIDKKALILVDLQNDFCDGGLLSVPEADSIIPLVNRLQSQFDCIVATLDWHPQDHMSFAINHDHKQVGDTMTVGGYEQTLWPAHCVKHSEGAKLHPDLDVSRISHYVFKGADKTIDSYSAFFDNQHLRSTGLEKWLKDKGIGTLYFLGLATNLCVKYSCMDAIQLGFKTYVIADACKGVELQPGDIQKAYHEMTDVGVQLITSNQILLDE